MQAQQWEWHQGAKSAEQVMEECLIMQNLVDELILLENLGFEEPTEDTNELEHFHENNSHKNYDTPTKLPTEENTEER